MSLASRVLSYIDAVRRSPANGSSPEWLGTLEADAFNSLDGAFFALNAPVAPLTWEVRTILPGTQLTSDRIPFDFPHPVEILGFRSVVAPIPGGAGIDPGSVTGLGTDVVDCQLDLDKSEFVTFAEGVSTPGGPNNSNMVTLSALDIQAPRIQSLRLTSARPQIGFTFQWTLGIATPFQDSVIKVAMYIRDITGMMGVNVPSQTSAQMMR
jgi:hypothetical protein